MILIYADRITERLKYAASVLFESVLQHQISFTSNETEFINSSIPKINYSVKIFEKVVHINPDSILFETEIVPAFPQVMIFENVTCLYPQPIGDLPYDCFAAAFFMASRYEEYLPFEGDMHSRFPSANSFAVKNNFHRKPVVNYYAMHVKKILEEKFASILFSNSEFRFTLTYDIDIAFKYAGRQLLHTAGGFVKNLLIGNFADAFERLQVIRNKKPDPWDTFQLQTEWKKIFHLHCVYFFLVAERRRFDRAVSVKQQVMQQLIQDVSRENSIGIHPGYAGNSNARNLKTEIETLEKLSHKKIIRSRQHYLKLNFPETFNALIENEIAEDWSLGFSDNIGFRSGLATEHFWFNLKENKTTTLKLFPMHAMDAALFYNMKKSSAEAQQMVFDLINEVKKVKGHFVFLSHNELIHPQSQWKGWHQSFQKILETVTT